MEPRPLQFFASACGGTLLSGAPTTPVLRVNTDSRTILPGDLFVALAGEKFDGHEYVKHVAEKGAVAAVISGHRAPGVLAQLAPRVPLGLVTVTETRAALGRMAGSYRADFALPIVAVAGSNGKTTTKELLASILRQDGPTLWSEASFNNDIGVPLTLLRLESAHRAAVLEVGTNHPGELAPLVGLVQPRFGIITSIGREHLEYFRDLAGVAQEEGWLAELLPADGALFINGDSPMNEIIVQRTRCRVVLVGTGPNNSWRAVDLRPDERGVAFRVVTPRPDFAGEFRVNLLGRHQVTNALLALATAAELGVSPDAARRGLEACAPAKMRLQVWRAGGITVLDDAYNANADSMLAALQTLRDFPCTGRRVAVLGDMAELGEFTPQAHVEIGAQAAKLGVDLLVCVGRWASVTAESARATGLQTVSEFALADDAASALPQTLRSGDVVLLKASRSAALERVGESLRTERANSTI